MSVFSRLRGLVRPAKSLLLTQKAPQQAVRFSHDRVMEIKPSSYHWKQFADDVHFYLCLTGIPLFFLITGVNVFVGPATLSDIPEGYEPKEYEYHRSPITRFLVKYCFVSPQSVYEKTMCALQSKHERYELSKLEKKVRQLSWERGDYQAWSYLPKHAELMTRISIEDKELMSALGHPDD